MVASRKKRNRRATTTRPRSGGFANHFVGNAVSIAGAMARSGKDYGADKIAGFAEVVRSYSGSVTSVPNAKEYIDLAAQSLEGFADYITETEFEEMVDDATRFARRHPWAVVSAGLAGGLLAAQILRSGVAEPRRVAKPSASRSAAKRKSNARKMTQANGQAHSHSPQH